MRKRYEAPVIEVSKFALSADILESGVDGGEEWISMDPQNGFRLSSSFRGPGFGWEE